MVVGKGGNMARMANRVVQVAKGEADNSEDPEFKQKVSGAASELDAGRRCNLRILCIVSEFRLLILSEFKRIS